MLFLVAGLTTVGTVRGIAQAIPTNPKPPHTGKPGELLMFNFPIKNVPTVFSKFFGDADREAVLEAIPTDAKTVLFVDTGATPVLAETIAALTERGVGVVVRDHHKGEGRTPEAAEQIEEMLGGDAHIVDRASAPGCAELIGLGQFAGFDAIVADPDYDGLVATMKAVGVTYEGMDTDAEIFDVRPNQSAETLTELGWTAVRALSTLPPFNKERPEVSENAKKDLFARFVAAAEGNAEARGELESAVEAYEAGVTEAKRLLAEKMSHPCKGIVMIDSVGAARSDLNTLARGMETNGAIVTVVRKDFGPIAGKPGGHGVQYSLAVVRGHQSDLDLRDLVLEGMESSPQAGLLSNTSFLLHCSETVWTETILPGLSSRFAS